MLGFWSFLREAQLLGGAGIANSRAGGSTAIHPGMDVGLLSFAGKSGEEWGTDTECGLAPQESQQVAVSSLLGHTA